MATVELKDLNKRFGTVRVVEDVNLSIADGEFMVLLGPSGCGKSTTLRMIAGLETSSGGDIVIDGRRVNDLPAKERDIAMVFQSYALYPHMNVRDNLAFGLRRRRIDKAEIERRVAQAASSLGLGPYLDRRPNALSGGQRQRVAVGRAIVRDPKVFLFDEPLSNLDASLRVSTRAELAALHQRLGATMIYVTHDQVEAMTMGTRICIMKDGRVMQVGAPMDVYREPRNVFVAGFLGSPPMNLVPAEVTAGTGAQLCLGDTRLPLGGAPKPGPVTLGIRPEELEVAVDRPDESCFHGSVTSIEQLGAETIVALGLHNGGTLRARLDNRARVSLGETLHLRATPGSLHLFDPASGDLVGRS